MDVEGFILVGGASSRMGSNKAQLTFGEQTTVQVIAAALGSGADRVRVVGSAADTTAAGFENVPDLQERWGALGGINAALRACQANWAMIVACDLPLVTPALFARMLDFDRQDFDALVPIQPDGRPQPLCAIYRREVCRALTEELIGEGEHMPRAMLAQVRTRWIDFDELAELPGADNFFLNVNTPADYERAREIFENRKASSVERQIGRW